MKMRQEMGSRDDWKSKKGMTMRQKGMKKKESKQRKICYCVIFAVSTAIYVVFGGLYGWRSTNAMKIQVDFAPRDTQKILYDFCSTPAYIKDPELTASKYFEIGMEMVDFCSRGENCEKGTQWSAAFAFNSTVLILSAANFIVMTFGAFFFAARIVGTWCNFCCGCCHCLAFSMALGVAYNPMGYWCSANVSPVEWDGKQWSDAMTYKSDG